MANLGFNSSSASSSPPATDFPSDQAELLHDLALHGYGDAGSNGHGQANGEAPSLGQYTTSFNAYGTAGLSSGFGDMDDSVALLESLANFDQGSSSIENLTPAVSNDHFASLLEAAATAGGQEAQQHGNQRPEPLRNETSPFFKRTFLPPSQSTGKRKRAEAQPSRTLGFLLPTKRQQTLEREAAEREREREREIWGPDDIDDVDEDDDDDDDDDESATSRYERPLHPTADARALGVHSAAALFRRPSAASKKYTRAPMSKLFTSLQVTPEQFLHLQAAAKAYMLDEKHPERSDCVGGRYRGDSDMVKLKLFGCAESFLEDEGWGERCFGSNAMGAEQRKLKWPEMKNKIISLISPLLRRMVANERQRQYASATRKSKASATLKTKPKSPPNNQLNDPQINTQPTQPRSPSQQADIDPKLGQYHYNINTRFSSTQAHDPSQNGTQNKAPSPIGDETSSIKYQINILKDNHRVKPKVTLTPVTCPGLSNLIQHIGSLLDTGQQNLSSIKALGPDGQVDVKDENSWKDLVALVKEQEWMDGEVKVIVQV